MDTRTLQPGDLYFALRGPNHDGHDYVAAAMERGAAAAVVDRQVPGAETVLVSDTLARASDRWQRRDSTEWGGEVVGVTGSAGKTTTKDAIAHLLSVAMPVGKTTGNLNNHVGVPLSILRLPEEARPRCWKWG